MNDSELDELLDTWKAPSVPATLRAGFQSRLPAKPRRRVAGIPRRWIAAVLFAAGMLAVGASLTEDATLGGEAGPWDSQTYVRRTRIVHPALAKLKWGFRGGLSTGWQWQAGELTGSVYLLDRSSRAHYGYSWTARPLGAGKYLFTVQSLHPSALKEAGPIMPLPHPPAPAIVTAGNTFDVDLYESGSERVYDHIELSAQPLGIAPAQTPLTITLTEPKLLINGQFAAGPGGVLRAEGPTVTVAVPERGRFTLTLDPRGDARFLPAGVVNGSGIEFQAGGERFRIDCSAPVAPGQQLPVFVYFQLDRAIRTAEFSAGGPTLKR